MAGVNAMANVLTRSRRAPVVFLHGTAGSRRQWQDLIDRLPGGFESLALDLPGYTAHEVPQAERSLSTEADMILQKLRALGRPVHLIGHSYGAALALRIAVKWPDMVQSLTLFEPAIFHLLRDGHPVERQMFAHIAGLAQEIGIAAAAGRPDWGAARFVDFWNGPGSFAVYAPETRERVTARMPLIRANFSALHQETWPLEECARVTCPMLGLYGENSPLLSQHLIRLVAGQMPQAKVLPVAGAGHMLPVTHAAMAARLIGTHLNAVEARMPDATPRVA